MVPEPSNTANEGFHTEYNPVLIIFLQKIRYLDFFFVNFAADILDFILHISLYQLTILERTLKCKIKRQNRACEIIIKQTMFNDAFQDNFLFLYGGHFQIGHIITLQNQKDAYWRSATLLSAKLSTFSEIY